jgi:hypothetical protein
MSYRRNTSGQTVYAVMVDATTGAAVTTGVAVDVSKDGAAAVAGTGTLTHISNGLWAYTFAAGELDATATGFVFFKSGAVPSGGAIRTVQVNPDDAARAGLTALPNAAANTTGGLPTRGGAIPDATAGSSGGLPLIGSAPLTNLDASIAAVKAKTDNLPPDPADASDIAAAFGTVNTTLGTIAGYIDTEVAAIKAKTDLIPAGGPLAASDYTAPPTTSAIVTAFLGGTPTPRNVSSVTVPTVADCLVAAFVGTAGAESVSGTTYLIKQPDGSATFRSFLLDSSSSPTSRT